MAASSALVDTDVMGKNFVKIFSWDSASVTTGTISTGFTNIKHISPNNLVTEDVGKWVASGGTITWSGVTSGDTGTVLVIGN